MSNPTFKRKVEKALKEIEYDKWHTDLHTEIRIRAVKEVKPSHKEQVASTICGECGEILQYRVPAQNNLTK